MARTKKRHRRGLSQPPSLPAGMQRARPPKTRLKALFQVLVDVSAMAEKAMLTVPLPQEESRKRVVMFDAGVLLRASNALKAVRVLCEQAHWEFAAPILRQLFELVINMEHVANQPDREAAIFRYSKYGLLQKVRHQHLTLLYDQKTGRPIDTQRLGVLEQMLDQTFPEFRSVDDKGKVHWKQSWSGHSTRYLAEQSKHRLPADQYELMFVAWSEQAHGAPGALMDNMFPARATGRGDGRFRRRGDHPDHHDGHDVLPRAVDAATERAAGRPGAAARVDERDDRGGTEARRALP